MRKAAVISILFSVIYAAFADEPQKEPVKVYCFSADLEAGFKDIPASSFCAELKKMGEKKKSIARVGSGADAQMIVHFISAETLRERGEAIYLSYGIAWNPSTEINRREAIISVNGFSKRFVGEGMNATASYLLAKKIEEWIRANRDTILKKAKQK